MKNKNLQGGFAPLLIIAIIAILAIGGGAYVVTKNKEAKVNTEAEGNVETQANANADLNANENANLGINAKAKGSFRSLLALGKNTECTFTSENGGVSSSGTVYIASSGNMRGDFSSKTSAGTQTSNMILKDGYSYVWSGSQGAKMNVKDLDSKANSETQSEVQAKQSVDMDAQVDYDCKAWSVDESKFAIPSSVNFLDIEAMMKASGGVDIESMMKLKGN